MDSSWPFDQPPNCATFTTTFVVKEGKPITHVYHDESDHGWQFHSSDDTTMDHAMLVSLKEIVKLDASVLEVADLEPGWMAYKEAIGAPWQRCPNPERIGAIEVDWSQIRSKDEFYDSVFEQCGAPSWHGRNLDALNDSWVTGSINADGPPFDFRFQGINEIQADMKEFMETVHTIAQDSASENGGSIEITD